MNDGNANDADTPDREADKKDRHHGHERRLSQPLRGRKGRCQEAGRKSRVKPIDFLAANFMAGGTIKSIKELLKKPGDIAALELACQYFGEIRYGLARNPPEATQRQILQYARKLVEAEDRSIAKKCESAIGAVAKGRDKGFESFSKDYAAALAGHQALAESAGESAAIVRQVEKLLNQYAIGDEVAQSYFGLTLSRLEEVKKACESVQG